MTNQIGKMIAPSCSLGLLYAKRLLQDISADNFARFAQPGGQLVISNHPAFIYGHLSLYAVRIVKDLQGDISAVALPESFECLFSKDATCQDDTDGTMYPAMDVVLDHFFRGYEAAEQILKNTDDSAFQQINPMEGRLRELFPTLGAMHAFYVSGHFMGHMGQLSAWRRMMGLQPG